MKFYLKLFPVRSIDLIFYVSLNEEKIIFENNKGESSYIDISGEWSEIKKSDDVEVLDDLNICNSVKKDEDENIIIEVRVPFRPGCYIPSRKLDLIELSESTEIKLLLDGEND